MASIRKLQIRAYDAQLMVVAALRDYAETIDSSYPSFSAWHKAKHVLEDMLLLGYAPRLWSHPPYRETGDETPEEIETLDELN